MEWNIVARKPLGVACLVLSFAITKSPLFMGFINSYYKSESSLVLEFPDFAVSYLLFYFGIFQLVLGILIDDLPQFKRNGRKQSGN